MIWPSFRAVSSAACLSASACFNLHTQTKAGDTNMQNKKKKTIKTNYDKNICLLYMCTSLYSRWNRTYWNIKMDKRTWFLKYNNLWKIKKFTIFGLRIDLKFLITTWKNFENLSSSQTHYIVLSYLKLVLWLMEIRHAVRHQNVRHVPFLLIGQYDW